MLTRFTRLKQENRAKQKREEIGQDNRMKKEKM
jgi:hypothetical protein